MNDFDIIQETATGKAWYFRGDTLPEGCKLNPKPDVERLSGWWKPATQMPIVESCVGENAGKVPCEVFSRVVGYITSVKVGKRARWNKGKFQEFKERATYRVESKEELEARARASVSQNA